MHTSLLHVSASFIPVEIQAHALNSGKYGIRYQTPSEQIQCKFHLAANLLKLLLKVGADRSGARSKCRAVVTQQV